MNPMQLETYIVEQRSRLPNENQQRDTIQSLVKHYANQFREEKRRHFFRPRPQQ